MIKIYLKPIRDLTHRTWVQLKQGLEEHSEVELVKDKNNADFQFVHWVDGSLDDLNNAKVVYFDFNDTQGMCIPDNVIIHKYFKRSMASSINHDGVRNLLPYKNFVKPISHASIMREFKHSFIPHSDRRYDVVSTFREGHATNALRLEMQNYLQGAFTGSKLRTRFREFNSARSFNYDKDYHSFLRDSKIIITMNPLLWEGDNRLYEAMASGALVFCDNLYINIPHKFEDNKHLIYYNAKDYRSLVDKIQYFIDNENEREEIAKSGYEFAMKYHTPLARIDYILNEISYER